VDQKKANDPIRNLEPALCASIRTKKALRGEKGKYRSVFKSVRGKAGTGRKKKSFTRFRSRIKLDNGGSKNALNEIGSRPWESRATLPGNWPLFGTEDIAEEGGVGQGAMEKHAVKKRRKGGGCKETHKKHVLCGINRGKTNVRQSEERWTVFQKQSRRGERKDE